MSQPDSVLSRLLRRATATAGRAALNRLPPHYRTPTSQYAAQKALKDITSAIFMGLDRAGIHLLPKHFYTPIPDYAWLRENRACWDRRASMAGEHWELDEQLAWLGEICAPYLREVSGSGWIDALYRKNVGPGFGPIDSQVLHCVMRTLRPPRVIEIGSGVSTAVMIAAAEANRRDGLRSSRITSVDPYPTDALREVDGVDIIADLVQRVPIDLFDELGNGDLLFIDSSHAVKVGSDVIHLFMHVLPRLAEGVLVHIHDISLPYLYPRTALADYFGWQETTLLLALMTGNPRLQPLASLAALHYDRADDMREILPDYRRQQNDAGLRTGDWVRAHFPDSIWLRIAQVAPAAGPG